MENLLKIGQFAKLAGVTVKTVLHYDKVGLLTAASRSDKGYRLYGPAELNRMLSIKRLKSLGLSLEQIRSVMGKPEETTDLRSVLVAMETELQKQIDTLNRRLTKVQRFLDEDICNDPTKYVDDSPSLKLVVNTLGEDAAKQYMNTCPEMYELERKMCGIVDDLEWGIEYEDSIRVTAEYFRDNPEQYKQALDFGTRITELGDIDPDSPIVNDLARDYSAFIKQLPFCTNLLDQEPVASPLESMWSGLVSEIMTPAQLRMLELLGQYLISGETAGREDR